MTTRALPADTASCGSICSWSDPDRQVQTPAQSRATPDLRGWPAARDRFALRCDNHPVNWQMICAGFGTGFGLVNMGRQVTHQALRHTARIAAVWTALEEGLKPYLS